MKKYLLFVLGYLSIFGSYGQTIEITANAGSSATPALGTSSYTANEAIYTETEIGGPGNFVTAATAINRVALSVSTVGANTTFGNVKIYFKDVALTTTSFTSGTYTTAGYTLCYSGPVTLAAEGFTDIVLNSPYVRASGTNLQMLIERQDAVTHTGFVYNCANGNHTGSTVSSTRRYNGTTALSGTTNMLTSAFRQAVRLKHVFDNDARVNLLYTLSKAPIPNGAPMIIRANVFNEGLNALTNLNVTLTVTGANSFTDTKTISALAVNANDNVSFASFTPTAEGTNTVTVTVGADDYEANNAHSVLQVINNSTWSYAYGPNSSGGVGFTGATGDFVAKFNSSQPMALSQVTVNFAGVGEPYQLGIWDATGAGGTPGVNLYTSATLNSFYGPNVIPVNPVNIAAGDFYVGVRQTASTNVNFAYQTETPIRTGTFYYASPSGATTWNDFAPANPFRFMIEPKLILPVDASVASMATPANLTCHSTPQTYTALLTNKGSTAIAANAAAVTLRVRGANNFTGTVTNAAAIASGASELISFTNVNINNPGKNLDTVFVMLAGDMDAANDTAKTNNITTPIISTFPFTENFDNTIPGFSYWAVVAGSVNITWLSEGPFNNNANLMLTPHSSPKMIVFDNYSDPNSAGVVNRVYSECINLPATTAGECANYQISFWMSHDASFPASMDSLYVTVTTNGGTTWSRLSPGYGRYDAAFTAPGWKKEVVGLNAYAGQTIRIGFENVSKSGNIIALDDIEISSAAAGGLVLSSAANNAVALQRTCDDQGWSYYADPVNVNQPLFAIDWDAAATGANVAAKAAAILRIQLDAGYYAAEDIPNKKATYTMRRYWNVDLAGSVMTAPVNVRFFYDSTERNAITAAAQNFAAAHGAIVEPASWFKTTTAPFVPNAVNVTPGQITQASVTLTNVNSSNASINGVVYAQFNGVSSFSGGTYATGVGTGTVLPVKVEYFRGSKQGGSHLLDWKVTSIQTQYVTLSVEISADGNNFHSIYSSKETALRCLQAFSYTNKDLLTGVNYYRLKMLDDNGSVAYSSVVALVNAGTGIALMNITPNPVAADGRFKLNVASPGKGKMEILITDVTGRIMLKQVSVLVAGFNAIDINVSKLASGVYQVYGNSAEGRTRLLKFIK